MISNVTSSSQAVTATSAASSSANTQNDDISTVNMPFGKLFVENLNSDSPVVVGFDYGHGLQGTSGDSASSSSSATSSSTASSSSAASSAALTAKSVASVKALDTSSSSSSSSSSSDTILTGVDSSDPTYVPTAESVFGDTPWDTSVTGTGPTGTFTLNSEYFASESTAEKVAAMVGGTVVQVNTLANTSGNPFSQSENNEMVKLADGNLINAGLVAGFFTHGYQLSMVSQMVQNEVANVDKEAEGASNA